MHRTALLVAGLCAFAALPAFGEGEITSAEDCARYLQQAHSQSDQANKLYAVQLTEDQWIQHQLQQGLRKAQELDAATIATNVTDGVVTLGGSVEDQAKAERAVALAQAIPGVRDVNHDLLYVQGQQSLGQTTQAATEEDEAEL